MHRVRTRDEMPGMSEINLFRNSTDGVSVGAGDFLFRVGDPGDVMFAVVEGEVDLRVNDSVVETVRPGGILGELSLIDHAPRSADAQARTPARVVKVDEQQFVFLVQEHPTFALEVMKVMAERMRRTNEAATATYVE